MLLIVERQFRGEICHAIHWYVKGKNKWMKDYAGNEEPLCVK